jgi:signal transduction histidine kinase
VKRHLVFFYWLLLLVSTLAIGGVTFFLLQRESDRLRNMAAAAAARTGQTIAGRLDALVNQIKITSMGALAQLPEAGIETQLLDKDTVKEILPYARSVFYYVPRTGLEIPRPQDPERALLESLVHYRSGWIWNESFRQQQRSFMFTNVRGNASPGNNLPIKPGQTTAGPNLSGNSLVDNNGSPIPIADNVNLDIDANNPNGSGVQQLLIQLSNGSSFGISTEFEENIGPNVTDTGLNGTLKISDASTNQSQVIAGQQTFALVATSPDKPEQIWLNVGPVDDSHWLGCWRAGGPLSPVRGLLLSWDTLEKSMGTAFPDRLDAADGFILRNPAKKPVIARFANGALLVDNSSKDPVDDLAAKPAFKPTFSLPVGAEMPGWSLEVYFNPEAKFSSNFMALSTVLVTVLVICVLVGGTLLMREARREAFEAARKTSFVSNVSHELKTPLTTIRMYAELLGEGRVRDQAKQHSYLATIISESQRLTRLVNNVLDFSRMEQGRKQYHPDNVSLAEVIRSVIDAQRPRLEDAGFQVETDLTAAADLHVHTDRDALEQVMLNLIDNALKYAADGRWLGVRIAHDAERATLTVSDHGPGVPTDQQEKIFEIFHRVDDSITARLPGAGLGLSIARRLLRDQEGDLHYEPNIPTGASFVASLPLALNEEKSPPPAAGTARATN